MNFCSIFNSCKYGTLFVIILIGYYTAEMINTITTIEFYA